MSLASLWDGTLEPAGTALPPLVWPADAEDRLAPVLALARSERGTPWPQPTASTFARFRRDGDRVEHEALVFAHRDRLTRAVLAALADPSDRLDEVADGVLLVCDRATWCWPAHEDHCRDERTLVPDPDNPFLDLGAAEVGAQLAWLDHALGDRLDLHWPGLRARVRREVRARVLVPFDTRDDWHWLGLAGDVHNWCAWICGNVLVAALRLGEGNERSWVVAKAVAGLDRYLAALPPDGSVDEGHDYWWNGAGRVLEALDVLDHAAGLSGWELPVVGETARFPRRMHLGGPWFVNVADARARPPAEQPWHVLVRTAQRIGDVDVERHASARRADAIPAHVELGRALRDLALPLSSGEERTPDSVWLPGTQLGVAHAPGLALVVKGGHNAENHNHNDVGSVIVAVDGVPVLVDAGRPTYSAATFGPDRYDTWTMQSGWHNVPEVRGTAQAAGRRHRAREVEVEDTPDAFRVRMDLAEAYPVAGLRSWWRTATLDRSRPSVTVEDRWDLVGEGPPSTLHYLVAGRVVRDAPGRVKIHPLGGARATFLAWESGVDASLTVRELDDPILTSVWGATLTRVELRLPATARGSSAITVEVLG